MQPEPSPESRPGDERADQILAIGRVLSRMPTGRKDRPYMGIPAPIIPIWAAELYDDFGVRVHADLAKKELVRVQSPMGNNGPVQAVTKGTPARMSGNPQVKRLQGARVLLMDWLRQNMPDMADRVDRAQRDPELAAILLNDIAKNYPEVWQKAEEIMATMPAEASG